MYSILTYFDKRSPQKIYSYHHHTINMIAQQTETLVKRLALTMSAIG